ncbi:MAG: 5-(carboxyamino)imidazole ribonucleotide mutase [Methanobacteriaceae archaeon]|jgi:5-(carboxyamino)imidazole ribonucleotide mutase|nr:5-(carboxyamino)imidazole ribonucleotide mutase [Methanobacteriaceae archaeon]
MAPKVMIILGSASDLKIAQKSIDILEELQISYSLKIASAHRTHALVRELVIKATNEGVDIFIGIAGLAAHLPGTIIAYTHKPVIGVPVDVKVGGIDALLSSVQMPFPAPVATVGIDRGDNAAILAAQILGINNEDINKNVSKLRKSYREKVINSEKGALLELNGKYIEKNFLDIESLDLGIGKEFKKLDDKPEVAIIPGSHSDMGVAKKVAIILDRMKIKYDMRVISPIRHPNKFEKYVMELDDAKLFIAISGLSSHVTGALVGLSEKPIIGVPCSKDISMDALLSMVNMPPGVPVGTVGLNNGRNGGIYASEILALSNKKLEENLKHIKYKTANL